MLHHPLGRCGEVNDAGAGLNKLRHARSCCPMHGPLQDGRSTGTHHRVCASMILTTAPHRKTKFAPFPKEVTKARYPRSPIQWVVSGSAPRAQACPTDSSEGSLEGERSKTSRSCHSTNSPPERVSWCILGKISQ